MSDALKILLALVALMWAVEVVDVIADHQLDQYGIEARDVDGLDGIVTAPFLHVGFAHLISNTIPFVIMGLLIAVEGARRLVVGVRDRGPRQRTRNLARGSGGDHPRGRQRGGLRVLHLPDRPRLVQPARRARSRSGWSSWRCRGGVLLGGLQPQEGISWQGHLFGAIGGVVAARVLARGDAEPARAPA